MPSRVVDGGPCDCCSPGGSSAEVTVVDILLDCCDPGVTLPISTLLFVEITLLVSNGVSVPPNASNNCTDDYAIGTVFAIEYVGEWPVSGAGNWHLWRGLVPRVGGAPTLCDYLYWGVQCRNVDGVFRPVFTSFNYGADPAGLATTPGCGGGGFFSASVSFDYDCDTWPAVGTFSATAGWLSNTPSPCGVLDTSQLGGLLTD